ncbi:MAG: 50S ribosomal protein L13 [Candidatus Staskawiczbacteria bacterium CG10_big_fil_rev_8_21_14_0_10_38_10]|uniref:Large ribosomal subunit protein uL13 n=1 Tax=Candidatus Staskawiczbacteria bacterium CG10_big_fil_rev_8_21_14_0_10_38_10 TaxID=1974891 RepID=A0A2H9T1M7_9BACT|nr:MAG: 50S ribosomal protein L13 [Candidatus Staskawiczbacteria bacterium CG10_big_fil_rev_8_21_14_0_10_38_10]
MTREKHTIDATGKILGKLAVEIAILLRGKHKSSYVPNQDIGDFVLIKNVDKIKFSGKKFDKNIYYHHTKYLGGLKQTPLKILFKKDPAKVLRMAVSGMLPKNKLRARQIKRLKAEK